MHAFADEAEATRFSESDVAVGGGVKVASAAVEFGPLMDLRRRGAGAAYVILGSWMKQESACCGRIFFVPLPCAGARVHKKKESCTIHSKKHCACARCIYCDTTDTVPKHRRSAISSAGGVTCHITRTFPRKTRWVTNKLTPLTPHHMPSSLFRACLRRLFIMILRASSWAGFDIHWLNLIGCR